MQAQQQQLEQQNFNPRTREGCDVGFQGNGLVDGLISIHAPVKGATSYCPANGIVLLIISIHAPVKGATAWKTSVAKSCASFQSTHP